MEQHFSLSKVVLGLAIIVCVIGVSAFRQTGKVERDSFRNENYSENRDTTPPRKRNRNNSSLPDDKLEAAMKKLDSEMQKLEVEMKKLTDENIKKELDQHLSQIDMEKIELQVEESLKSINWGQINKQIDESTTSLNKEKMAEVKKEIEKVKANLKVQNQELKIKKVDVGKIREVAKRSMEEAKISMEEARESMETAREEMKFSKTFIDELQKDGLIDKTKGFKVEVRNGSLFLNGKEQSKEVSEKYRRFYKKDNFTIKMQDDDRI